MTAVEMAYALRKMAEAAQICVPSVPAEMTCLYCGGSRIPEEGSRSCQSCGAPRDEMIPTGILNRPILTCYPSGGEDA
jgi:Zn finger protein HypA/HybF involved in hydrogenase expression